MNLKSNNANIFSVSVRESAYSVTKHSKLVEISDKDIKNFTENRVPRKEHWLTYYPSINKITDVDNLLDILFVFNSISFCYWGDPKWSVQLGGKVLDGSQLLLNCLSEQINKDGASLEPKNLAKLQHSEFINMLKGASNLLFVKERYKFLRMLGEVICDKYSGSYFKMITASDGTAQGVLAQLINSISDFEDVSTYGDLDIYYFKRAQLLVSDINHCLIKSGFEGLKGTETLTACADYKLPQMLRMLGVLKYDDSLANRIDALEVIEKDSPEENEIRSATVVAVDKIVDSYQQLGEKVESMNVNDDLWILSQTMSKNTFPYHRVRTTKY